MIFAGNKGWIGMDLGAARIKVAQVQRTGGHWRLAASAIVPRHALANGQPAPAADTELGGRIAGAVARHHGGLSGSQAACVLPIGRTDLRTLKIPASGDAERQALIVQELMDLVDDYEHRVHDYWVCPVPPKSGDGGVMEEVGVVSAPRDTVSRLTDDLAAARYRCEVIDGLPLVLARAVRLVEDGTPQQPVATVQWGYDSSVFCLVADGLPAYTRHLRNCGFVKLIDALCGALRLTESEAYEVLMETGLPDPQSASPPQSDLQEVLAELTADALQEFCEELQRTVSFLQTQYPELVARRMYLMGDGAAMRNAELHVQQSLGLTVSPWQMPCVAGVSRQPHHQYPQLFAASAALSALAFLS